MSAKASSEERPGVSTRWLTSLCFDILGSTTRVVPAPRVHCQTGRARLPLQRPTVPEELAQRESATVQKDAAAAVASEPEIPQNYDAAASNFNSLEELESVETSAPLPLEDIGLCRQWLLVGPESLGLLV
ncbi:uncharacterized protein LOC142559419 [Dermacentor variabilis]|uniref:uncharacterized protein LOC142559419 n=1 Tax=Dermacentor variabilis TaxID=34621 RepID=UPI003F5C1C78